MDGAVEQGQTGGRPFIVAQDVKVDSEMQNLTQVKVRAVHVCDKMPFPLGTILKRLPSATESENRGAGRLSCNLDSSSEAKGILADAQTTGAVA